MNKGWKKGKEASIITQNKQYIKRISNYNNEPKLCSFCDEALEYKSRHNKFCNKSCSASYNNQKRIKKLFKWNCKNCNKEYNSSKWQVGKYCDSKCQKEYEYSLRITNWLNNESSWKDGVPGWAKRYLLEESGHKCEICDIVEWNNKRIVLECDHIDGHYYNNKKENLRMICPNCHSQTDTYKAKNIGNGRPFRNKNFKPG